MIDNYQNDEFVEDYKPVDPNELRLTRRLALVWLAVGLVLAGLLCYFLTAMLSSINKGKEAMRIGAVSEFAPNSIQTIFINTVEPFTDPVTSKDIQTLALIVIRDQANQFRVFFARSTNPLFGIRAPRECMVTWQAATQRFEEPCSGAKWSREGVYSEGPAPRNLDQFPAQIKNNELWIELSLIGGAPHP